MGLENKTLDVTSTYPIISGSVDSESDDEWEDNVIEIADKHNLNYFHIQQIFEKYPRFQDDLDQMEIDYKDYPDMLHEILLHVMDSWNPEHGDEYDDEERIVNMYSIEPSDLEKMKDSYWTVYDFEREKTVDCRDRQDHVRSRILNITRKAPLHTHCYFVKLHEKYGVCQGLLMKIHDNFPNFDFDSEIDWTSKMTMKPEHQHSYCKERLERYFIEHKIGYQAGDDGDCVNKWYDHISFTFGVPVKDLKGIFITYPQFTITGLQSIAANDYNIDNEDIVDWVHKRLMIMLKHVQDPPVDMYDEMYSKIISEED